MIEKLLTQLKYNNSPELLNTIGVEYHKLSEYDKSLTFYKRAFAKANNKMKETIVSNIGLVYYDIKDYNNALKHFSLYNSPESGWHKSLCYLNLLDLKNGFSTYTNRYKRRHGINDGVYFPNLPIPFTGIDIDKIKNKNLLVLNEQGFGDSIMFSKSFNIIKSNVKSITIQCYPELLDFFKSIYPDLTFFTERSFGMDFVKQFDCYTCDGDLYGITNANGIIKTEYTEEVKDIKNIGVCLGSNKKSKISDKKSIILSDLNLSGYNLYNLGLEDVDGLIPLKIDNFNDVHNHIKNMDLVISVDTAIAHISGLVNKKTILVIKDYLDWRWKYVDGNKSLIYPSIEIKNVLDFNI